MFKVLLTLNRKRINFKVLKLSASNTLNSGCIALLYSKPSNVEQTICRV